jgi:putative transposase
MKKSHFTETQILAVIQKQEKGIAIKDIVREMGVSEQTFYNWKAKYGGMQVSDIKKLRDMEAELSAYKKLVGELEFENRPMKALIEKKLSGLLRKERLLSF